MKSSPISRGLFLGIAKRFWPLWLVFAGSLALFGMVPGSMDSAFRAQNPDSMYSYGIFSSWGRARISGFLIAFVAGVTLALVFAGVMQLSSFVGGYSSLDDSCATPLFVALAAGGALGVLFAQMILERIARVGKSAWKSSLFMVCFFAVFVAGCSFDVLGVSRYVPDEGNVRSVSVFASDGNYGNWSNTKVESAGGEAMEKLESLLNCDEVQGE